MKETKEPVKDAQAENCAAETETQAATETEETTAEKTAQTNAQDEAEDAILEEKTVTMTTAEFEEVRKHIETLRKEKDETVALCQRLQADFDNYRKRNATIHLDSVNEGERNVIKGLLPALDNFERAMDNSESIDPAWLEGIKLVQRQLIDTLGRFGLEPIPTDGQFDPELHEAVMQQESEDAESGSIIMVMQKGYKVKDRIIRHSMVGVAK